MTPIAPIGRRGITLVELVIGVTLGLVVVFAAGSLYLSTQQSFRLGARKLIAQQEASLLSGFLSRQVRVGSDFRIYDVGNRNVFADSGNGLAILDGNGAAITRIEWDVSQETLVDSTGARVTAMKLVDVGFRVDPGDPQTVRYRFKTDDEAGNLVDMESAVAIRN